MTNRHRPARLEPLALLATACAADPASLYVQAANDPTHPRACAGIDDPRLHGECVAMTAAEVAALKGEAAARARCATLPAGDPWRAECYFLVSDRLEAVGEAALSLCDEAGPYRSKCAGHALQREARVLLSETPRGQESSAVSVLLERSALYFPDPREGQQEVWHTMVEHIASRDFGQPFSLDTCGQAPPPVCATAFVTRVRFRARDARSPDALRVLCAAEPRDAAAAAAVGLPTWSDDAEDIAQTALKRLCGPRR